MDPKIVMKINTSNDFMVGSGPNDGVRIMTPPVGRPISKEAALRLAAWLVAMTSGEDEFQAVLDAVLDT